MTFVFGLAGVLVLGLVVVAAGQRFLRPGRRTSGMADSLGNFIDVFDPARARADRDLKSHDNQGAVIPNPDGDEKPVEVDLRRRAPRGSGASSPVPTGCQRRRSTTVCDWTTEG